MAHMKLLPGILLGGLENHETS